MGTRKYLLKSLTVHPGGNIMGRFNCLKLSRFYIPYKVKGNLPLHVCGQTVVHSFSIQSSSWRLSSSTAHLLDKSNTGSPKK